MIFRRLSLCFILFNLILLISCSPLTKAKSTVSLSYPPTQVSTPTGQTLPVEAKATTPKGETIQLEVAKTDEQQRLGLMYRPVLPDDRGMLFPFSPPRIVSFWMENTPNPLDMIFLYQGEIKYIQASAPPCTSNSCPVYGPGPSVVIDQVIELRAGRAQELGLNVGDKFPVTPIQ